MIPRRLVVAAAAAALVLSACSAQVTAEVPTPTARPSSTGAGNPPGTCANPTQTLDPLSPLPPPGAMPEGILRSLASRGRLIVGVVADQQPLVWHDPVSGNFKGFEVELYTELARALTGDASKVEIRVVSPDDALTLLADQSVDVVLDAMAMTCGRWTAASMSAPYLQTQQQLLVRRGTAIADKAALAGKRVCIVGGTPYGEALAGATVVAAPSATSCLVQLQAGHVDAVSDTRPVLTGLAGQDPFTEVLPLDLGEWSLAVGVAKDRPDLVRFVNGVLAAWVADGGWKSAHDTWLAPTLGPGTPPAAQYGRRA